MRIKLPSPSPKQDLFLTDTHRYVAFGGARGGGKSWAVRIKAILLALKHKGIRICIIRRTYPELMENHIKPLKAMLKCGTKGSVARYNDSRKELKFRNRSEILFRYCKAEKDLDNFQGTEYDVIFIDEATQLRQEWIEKIAGCFRNVIENHEQLLELEDEKKKGGRWHGFVDHED